MFSITHPTNCCFSGRRDMDTLAKMLMATHPLLVSLTERRPRQEFWQHEINLPEFEPSDIKTNVTDDSVLHIQARHQKHIHGDDMDVYESKRSLIIPQNVDVQELSCDMDCHGVLFIRAPFKQNKKEYPVKCDKIELKPSEMENQDVIPVEPRTEENGDQEITDPSAKSLVEEHKDFHLDFNLGQFSPENISVVRKSTSLMIKAEKKEERDGMTSSECYVTEFSIPENVDKDKLRCERSSDGVLYIRGPFEKEQSSM